MKYGSKHFKLLFKKTWDIDHMGYPTAVEFSLSLGDVLEVVHSSRRFWQVALQLAGRAIKV